MFWVVAGVSNHRGVWWGVEAGRSPRCCCCVTTCVAPPETDETGDDRVSKCGESGTTWHGYTWRTPPVDRPIPESINQSIHRQTDRQMVQQQRQGQRQRRAIMTMAAGGRSSTPIFLVLLAALVGTSKAFVVAPSTRPLQQLRSKAAASSSWSPPSLQHQGRGRGRGRAMSMLSPVEVWQGYLGLIDTHPLITKVNTYIHTGHAQN